MLYQKENLKRLEWILGGMIILSIFGFVKIVYGADITILSQYDKVQNMSDPCTIQTMQFDSVHYATGFKIYGGSAAQSASQGTLTFCKGQYSSDMASSTLCVNTEFIASTSCMLSVNATTTCEFDNSFGVIDSTEYYFKLCNSVPGDTSGLRISASDNNPLSNGTLWRWGNLFAENLAAYDATFELYYNEDKPPYWDQWDTVEITELPEWNEDITVTTEAEELLFEDEKLCFIDYPCTYRIWYSVNEIGAFAAIIKQWYEEIGNADDYILELPSFDSVDSLKYDFDLETQTSATTTPYYLVVLTEDASSSALYEFDVHWVASSTDDLTQVSWLMKAFKNIFPISVILQIKEVFDSNTSTSSTELLNINLQDIIPIEHSGFSASGTILSSDLVNSNFSLWQELFYPWIKYFLWLITFVYIIIRMRNLATSSDTG